MERGLGARETAMHYGLTEEQVSFRDELRAFIEKHKTPALLAELESAGMEGAGGRGPEARKFRQALNDADRAPRVFTRWTVTMTIVI